MRQLTFLFFTFLLVYSCNDDISEFSATNLEGNWRLIEVNSSIALDLNNDGILSNNLQTERACVLDTEMILLQDGNRTVIWSFAILNIQNELTNIACQEYTSEGTWSIDNNKFIEVFSDSGVERIYQYNLAGNILTLFDTHYDYSNAQIDLVFQKQ